MKKKTVCPVCGNKKGFLKTLKPYTIKIGKGLYTVHLVNYICPECKCSVDLYSENDRIMQHGVDMALQDCAHKILDKFTAQGMYLSEIERLFYLPRHTLSKWKTNAKKPSAAAVMLLRIIDLCPWLNDAAETGFEKDKVDTIAASYYMDKFNSPNKSIDFYDCPDCYYAVAKVQKKNGCPETVSADQQAVTYNRNSFNQSTVFAPGAAYANT